MKLYDETDAGKAAGLFVALDRTEYNQGDTVAVEVQFVNYKPMAVSKLLVSLHCNENLQRYDSDGVDYTDTHAIHEETVELVQQGKCDRLFMRNKHRFYATFAAPTGLPQLHIDTKNYWRAFIDTYVEASLWIPANPDKPALVFKRIIPISSPKHGIPWLPVSTTNYNCVGKSPVRCVGIETSAPCWMTLQLDRPRLMVDGTRNVATIRINCPKPKAKIKSVQLVVIEYVFVHRQSTCISYSKEAVHWKIPLDELKELRDVDGSTKGCRLECVKQVTMDMQLLQETAQLHLIQITHRMAVKMKFHGFSETQVVFEQVLFLRG